MPLAAWAAAAQNDSSPPLAPGTPKSPERTALIDAFKSKAAGLDERFEKRSHRGSWTMPYRLFRPSETGKAPLVLYLHGSGGLGDDNQKQLGLGNIFGTLLWALPENQKRFPCYVLAPQTDRGWANYKSSGTTEPARVVAGFGDGARLALDIVQALARELPIDERPRDRTVHGRPGHVNLDRASSTFAARHLLWCMTPTRWRRWCAHAVEPHGDADRPSRMRSHAAASPLCGKRIGTLSTEYAGWITTREWAFTTGARRLVFAQRPA
jgi:hypothetical protein